MAAFFTPFFFGFIGAQIDLAGLADLEAVLLLLGITGLAIATKFVGAFLGAIREGAARATLIGWGMVPRGEVGIVVAGLGLSQGAIDGEIYTVVVGMAILTTLVVPPLLPVLVRRAERADAINGARRTSTTSRPTPGGLTRARSAGKRNAPPRRSGEGRRWSG